VTNQEEANDGDIRQQVPNLGSRCRVRHKWSLQISQEGKDGHCRYVLVTN